MVFRNDVVIDPMPQAIQVRLKMILGFALTKVMPRRAGRIWQAFSLPYWDSSSEDGKFAGRMIRFYLAHRDNTEGRGLGLEEIHREFWRHRVNAGWYDTRAHAFEGATLTRLKPVVATIADLLANTRIDTVCEIGTGDGRFIAYLREALPHPQRFIGLDLSAARMERNRALYERIDFVACDAVQWITRHSTNNTLFVTSGGVLEFFRQQSLETMLQHIGSTQDGSAIALFHEPLVIDHDLERDLDSRLTLRGEYSFSHNYPYLLKKAGFEIQYQLDDDSAGYRGMTLLARARTWSG